MELVDFITANAPAFIFVLVRTASIILAAPIFGAVMVPMQVKMGLSLILTLAIVPIVGPVAMPQTMVGLALGFAGEMLIGLTIGMAIRFVFTGVEFAGQLASFQMGLGMASAYDPMNSAQTTVLGRLMSILMLLVFLSINGHLMVIMSLKSCFQAIPPYGFTLTGPLLENFVVFSKEIFILAVTFAAPVIAVLVFVNVSLGIMAKTVPQLNMFAVGFSVTISAGFLVIGVSMSIFDTALQEVFERMWIGVEAMIGVMHYG